MGSAKQTAHHEMDGHATPLDAFVIEDDEKDCSAIASALEGLGLAVATFDNAKQALAALDRRRPKIIFLDVALRQSDAIDVIVGLSERRYGGPVQLFSGNARLLEPVQRIALRRHLTALPPLPKPLHGEIIARVIAETEIARMATS